MRRLLPVFALFLLAGCVETGGGDETARKFVVFFRHGDASITSSAQTVINTVAAIAKRHPNRQVLVAGFAAAHGNLDADEQLSAQRADNVAAALRADGVAADTVSEHARPPANEAPAVAARRVEISFPPPAA